MEFGNEKFHTMDTYENGQDMKQQDDSADLWADEDSLHFKDVPNIFGFFPSNAFMAFARSFYMFNCMSQKD